MEITYDKLEKGVYTVTVHQGAKGDERGPIFAIGRVDRVDVATELGLIPAWRMEFTSETIERANFGTDTITRKTLSEVREVLDQRLFALIFGTKRLEEV